MRRTGPIIGMIVGLAIIIGAITVAVVYQPNVQSDVAICDHQPMAGGDDCVIKGRRYTKTQMIAKQNQENADKNEFHRLIVTGIAILAGGAIAFQSYRSLLRRKS